MAAANKNRAEAASTDRDVAEIGGKTRPIDQGGGGGVLGVVDLWGTGS